MKINYKFLIILFLPFIYFFEGCVDSKTHNNIQKNIEKYENFDSLIQVHKNDILFLDFWYGMSNKQYDTLLWRCNKNGVLKGGKYVFHVDDNEINAIVRPCFQNDSLTKIILNFYKSELNNIKYEIPDNTLINTSLISVGDIKGIFDTVYAYNNVSEPIIKLYKKKYKFNISEKFNSEPKSKIVYSIKDTMRVISIVKVLCKYIKVNEDEYDKFFEIEKNKPAFNPLNMDLTDKRYFKRNKVIVACSEFYIIYENKNNYFKNLEKEKVQKINLLNENNVKQIKEKKKNDSLVKKTLNDI